MTDLLGRPVTIRQTFMPLLRIHFRTCDRDVTSSLRILKKIYSCGFFLLEKEIVTRNQKCSHIQEKDLKKNI